MNNPAKKALRAERPPDGYASVLGTCLQARHEVLHARKCVPGTLQGCTYRRGRGGLGGGDQADFDAAVQGLSYAVEHGEGVAVVVSIVEAGDERLVGADEVRKVLLGQGGGRSGFVDGSGGLGLGTRVGQSRLVLWIVAEFDVEYFGCVAGRCLHCRLPSLSLRELLRRPLFCRTDKETHYVKVVIECEDLVDAGFERQDEACAVCKREFLVYVFAVQVAGQRPHPLIHSADT
jgi:hypothetical protein